MAGGDREPPFEVVPRLAVDGRDQQAAEPCLRQDLLRYALDGVADLLHPHREGRHLRREECRELHQDLRPVVLFPRRRRLVLHAREAFLLLVGHVRGLDDEWGAGDGAVPGPLDMRLVELSWFRPRVLRAHVLRDVLRSFICCAQACRWTARSRAWRNHPIGRRAAAAALRRSAA